MLRSVGDRAVTEVGIQVPDNTATRVAKLIEQLTDDPTAHQAFESLFELGHYCTTS